MSERLWIDSATGIGGFKMKYRNFNTQMQCILFVGSIFIFFFTSSLISVVRADAIKYHQPDHNGYQIVQPDNPQDVENGEDGMAIPRVPHDIPDVDGPGNAGGPDAGGPGQPPVAEEYGWWKAVTDFFNSMLEALAF